MKILSLLMLLIFISCEAPVDSESSVDSTSSEKREVIELNETYNFNGYDYSVEFIPSGEQLEYCDNSCSALYILTRDDNQETITLYLKTRSVLKTNVDNEVRIKWSTGKSLKTKGAILILDNADSFVFCRDEEDHSDPFNPVYVEVCDEFRSI